MFLYCFLKYRFIFFYLQYSKLWEFSESRIEKNGIQNSTAFKMERSQNRSNSILLYYTQLRSDSIVLFETITKLLFLKIWIEHNNIAGKYYRLINIANQEGILFVVEPPTNLSNQICKFGLFHYADGPRPSRVTTGTLLLTTPLYIDCC